ncbi:alanine racemase [Lutibacter sp.]|uniref:alanine racemase n=1 Tax=Lutibacter sp. TaxID=1925666 RepID=UPI0035658B57
MFQSSTIELSTAALKNNLKFIKKRMKKGVRFCSVVKGNAYGHGIPEFVKMAISLGVDYFAVHSADEAYTIVKNIDKTPDIFIMGAIEGEAIDWAIENNIEFAVFDYQRLDQAIKVANKLNKKAKIHIEIETGMVRTGFELSEVPVVCEIINNNLKYITLQGLFTHFAGAESQANYFRVSKQIENFNIAHQLFKSKNLHPIYHHTSCSAALINYPETQGNMVRIGILQYGFWPNKETHIKYCGEGEKTPNLLKRIIKWKTKVLAVKQINKGNFVGYGTSYLALKNLNLAIIPVGYSHGYSRSLSNIGSVLINGKLAKIVGTINMNSLTVSTNSSKISKGDEVILIGKQHDKSISVNSFSEQSNLLNYELLTRLPLNIPRIIVK